MERERLSCCEAQVLTIIWKSDEVLALQEILTGVNQKYVKNWKPQTVSTFLKRLVEKGWLTTHRQGRYTYYHPTVTEECYRQEVIREMLEELYDNDTERLCADLKCLQHG